MEKHETHLHLTSVSEILDPVIHQAQSLVDNIEQLLPLQGEPTATVESYLAGMKKLGKDVLVYKKSDQLIARDRRGQADIADIDDQRRSDVDESQSRRFGKHKSRRR
jgi:hypothetical protein